MNFTPVSFDLTASADGTIHLVRHQENGRLGEGDLWLCGARLYWERFPAGGSWIDSPAGFFEDAAWPGFELFVAVPVSGGGPPAF